MKKKCKFWRKQNTFLTWRAERSNNKFSKYLSYKVNTQGPDETYKKLIINKIDRNEISNNIYWWSRPILPFLEAHYNMTRFVPTRSLYNLSTWRRPCAASVCLILVPKCWCPTQSAQRRIIIYCFRTSASVAQQLNSPGHEFISSLLLNITTCI